jgi:hypothetical protein
MADPQRAGLKHAPGSIADEADANLDFLRQHSMARAEAASSMLLYLLVI